MKKRIQPVGFFLLSIKTEQFAVFEEYYSPKKEVNLGTELQFKIDNQNKQIGVFLGFDFIQGKNVFIKINVSCHFRIEDNSWNGFINEKSGMLKVPKGFIAHLAMITIGTCRGVLFAKTESTPFSKYIIPTINVEEMVNEDVLFDLSEE